MALSTEERRARRRARRAERAWQGSHCLGCLGRWDTAAEFYAHRPACPTPWRGQERPSIQVAA